MLSHRDARVSILLNRGKGRFAHASGSPFRLETRPFALVPADIDGDSRVDLVGAAENRVIVRLGNARQVSFPAGPGTFDVAVGDVDEDGSLDVVASSFESDAVTVLLGRQR